ncbi:DUF747-domain-containing protein [Aspergillus campestris IBT 28561]|uniref:DUF747-domain-containing protein n=1 Tax=Aspergillus campestris (strain IBT 28561) TaxID=1392248 RepID=A0A2I1D0D6_ASPC2|nr:DUF747-domain-containing protein [Aspergillus campestris IBT 28561]PKY03336.1 DUF747-domain-containing protein [Aspergillus campestris IBT 28561]
MSPTKDGRNRVVATGSPEQRKSSVHRLEPSPNFLEIEGWQTNGVEGLQINGREGHARRLSAKNSDRRVDGSPRSEDDANRVESNGRVAGAPARRGQREVNGDRRSGQAPLLSEGVVFEEPDEARGVQRTPLVGVFEVSEGSEGINRSSGEVSSPSHQDKEKDRILKLSPAKMQALTSSPQSIPYRAAPSESEPGRRVVSDGMRPVVPPLEPVDESHVPGDKVRSNQESLEGAPSAIGRPSTSTTTTTRSRPMPSRAVSTPGSMRRQTVAAGNERLAQTWASRSKQDRLPINRESETKQTVPSSQMGEPALPSPVPPTIPIPPLSVPTYLQLELSSGRPSPLYIHRTAMSDFPYESSRVKLERLMNFLILPPALEQVLWFGTLACLDSWLYSFTILPLRFAKALYILLESWAVNLGVEFRYVSGFVVKGVGRVWRRRNNAPADSTSQEVPRSSEPGPRRSRTASMKQEMPIERPVRIKATEPRRRRTDTQFRPQHRRQKSIPSALMPDDKADILKGLLMIATCVVLMYFDASRMYHWIRGQAAIKLYVIYNVLEVSDRLFAAIGQDVLECLFSREALERRPDGRSKVFRPFGLFLLALGYTVTHATSLFYQVMTLNVAVNSYSNALITLLLSNQFVEIKSTVFKKFEKENLFQLTCADVVERFQLWLMLTIIASRNIVETGALNFIGELGTSFSGQASASTNSTPMSTPPRMASSILPQSFTIVPSSIVASFSHVNSFLPTLAQVLGPFLVVLGSEMLVDWLKHAYINKFNNTRPAMYHRFLDILAKDYYTNAFGDPNLMRRVGLPVIPLSCLFFRVSVQTYQMFLTALLPQQPSSTAVDSTSLSSIHSHYAPSPQPSLPPLTLRTILPASAAHAGAFFRQLLANAIPTPAQSVYIFTAVLLLTGFVLLLIIKLLLGMLLLTWSRGRYKSMKQREREREHNTDMPPPPPPSQPQPQQQQQQQQPPPDHGNAPRGREYAVEGSRRVGGWGVVEVNDDHRRWIYADDPAALKRLKAREEKERSGRGEEDWNMDHVTRYEMVAKRIW